MPDMVIPFNLPTVKVLGKVDEEPAFRLGTFTWPKRLTSLRGPTGPVPTAHVFGVDYQGKLTNGNHFGTCDVIIQGPKK